MTEALMKLYNYEVPVAPVHGYVGAGVRKCDFQELIISKRLIRSHWSILLNLGYTWADQIRNISFIEEKLLWEYSGLSRATLLIPVQGREGPLTENI